MSDQTRWTNKRRTFLKGAGVTATAGLAGCLGDLSGDGGDDDEVRMVLNPAEGDVDMMKQYEPLFNYLEDETGATIDATETSSYTATVDAIRNDQAEIADISPTGVIAAPDSMDVLGVRIAYGAEQYFSLIATTPDSGIEELADLEGTDVSLSDPLSVSGSLFPLYMLSEAGLDVGDAPDGSPEDFNTRHSDHSTARDELLQQDEVMAAGAGAFVLAPHIPEDQFSDQFLEISAEADSVGSADEEMRLLSESDPIPRAPIVARSNWDSSLKGDIEEALLNATEEDLIDEDSEEQLWFTGVEEGSIEDYDPIKNVMDALGLEFADLAGE
ncbi:substrate-binding domain-containing protein [Natronosalvus rutilus]|uniref:Substrate-binding domain-containing protein n=1 Tax=Natronosalvus rutilus TaxID=2953753 RepID=A0A9E7SV69_9EURY|nr:substrate-binding domain-containing protein [Natronosalvus rutilus]UTF53607.1 substrate-binding domain-containing protein [Natronosalvus rutilus]